MSDATAPPRQQRLAAALGACVLTLGILALWGARAQAQVPLFGSPRLSDLASRRSLPIVLLGAAATLAVLDDENVDPLARSLDSSPFEGGADFGNVYGNGAFLAAGTVSLWGAGWLLGSENTMGTARDLARGLVQDGLIVWTLKMSVDRTRPNGGPHSFPSGHTSSAFTVAPILMQRYGWRVGIPAYAVAVTTGLGRMEERKHFASDVLAGATLGILVGRAVARQSARAGLPGQLTAGPAGIGLVFHF